MGNTHCTNTSSQVCTYLREYTDSRQLYTWSNKICYVTYLVSVICWDQHATTLQTDISLVSTELCRVDMALFAHISPTILATSGPTPHEHLG